MVGTLVVHCLVLAQRQIAQSDDQENGDDAGEQQQQHQQDKTRHKATGGQTDDVAVLVVQPSLDHIVWDDTLLARQRQTEGDVARSHHLDHLLSGDVRLGRSGGFSFAAQFVQIQGARHAPSATDGIVGPGHVLLDPAALTSDRPVDGTTAICTALGATRRYVPDPVHKLLIALQLGLP